MATLAPRILVARRAVRTPCMALHAMRNGGNIESTLERIAQRLVSIWSFAAWDVFVMHGSLVERWLRLVALRRGRTDIGGHRIEIARGKYLVKSKRHLG